MQLETCERESSSSNLGDDANETPALPEVRTLTAAIACLQEIGCPQNLETLGIVSSIDRLDQTLSKLVLTLAGIRQPYIAPAGCDIKLLLVEGSSSWALVSESNCFSAGEEKYSLVKVLMLGGDESFLVKAARLGIAERDKLLAVERIVSESIEKIEEALFSVDIGRDNRC